ncbi:hypothetical protein K7887_07610 [Sutcliffiella horikoshii]|uniref:hypothetical protein n=1 Tax=Sutcliffiella horikoshii TaxID=79883 RepID=UPI001CBBBCCA|nr:hypothetical protein [Sutcliffiella horikoshii]UAL48787.1 hypothetical protein K7887_07610 [Sutcliffiella horikoshii]
MRVNTTAFVISEELIENIQEFNDSKFDLDSSIEIAKEILLQEMNEFPLSECNFTDNTWKLESLEQGRRWLNFDELKETIYFNKEINTDLFVSVVKCWSASLIPSMSSHTVHSSLRGLETFLSITTGLTNLNKDDISDHFSSLSEKTKQTTCISALNFFDFYTDLEITDEVLTLLYGLKNQYKIGKNTRILPPSKDILLFSKILEDYFSTPLSEQDYLKWFPVWLWWKITNIIPLRPSEYADIERNCLIKKDDNFYIKLPRKKQNDPSSKKIQIMDELYIPDTIYHKIEEYKNRTDEFGETETLISYLSIPHFSSAQRHEKKLNPNKFSTGIFYKTLEMFYDRVVFGKYGVTYLPENDSLIESNSMTISQKLIPGDTRHLAFINLKRQGYHPVEIARMGGHTSLQSQEHYFNHLKNFVDLEILELITKTDLDSMSPTESNSFGHSLGLEFVNKFVLRPSSTGCKIKLKDGYCTDPSQNCMVEDCWECDSWRITQEEFIQKKHILEEKIKNNQSYINEVIENLKDLYQAIYANIGSDEYYSSDNPEIKKQLINQSKRIDKAIHKYINLSKVKERIDSIGNKR